MHAPASDLTIDVNAFLEAIPDALLLVDQSGAIMVVNSEVERLFAYSREELTGRAVELLLPERFHETHPHHRGTYVKAPRKRPMGSGLQLFGRRKDGTEFPVDISLSALSVSGRMLVMAAIRDVTERIRIEQMRLELRDRRAAEEAAAHLRRLNEGLEERVRERTRQLEQANAELLGAEDSLKATNRELEAFTYSVSHDLSAPIRHIDGFARLLSEHLHGTLDETSRHYLGRIRQGAHAMGRLVDDLLHLARVARQDARPARVSLQEVVHEVVADMQTDAVGREIRWTIHPLPVVECDRGLVKILLTNVIGNAVKYTRPRQVALIEVGVRHSAHDRPVIFVRDNGVGFDMAYADKLFGAFQRLHRDDEFEGSGVGLATVQRIINKHGGEIWADSVPNEGATFSFIVGPEVGTPGGVT